MRHIGRNGIVLIMTMISICLTFMMLYSLMQYTGVGLASSGSFYDREAALQAAQSGVDYAITRMQKNHAWRGDSNCKYWLGTLSDNESIGYGKYDDGLFVKESYGNVVGLMKTRNGNNLAFRIKFSYEHNGADTFDRAVRSRFGLKGSSNCLPEFSIKSPYVSVNNVLNSSQVLVYRANDNGVGIVDETSNVELGSGDDTNIKRAYACHLQPQRLYLVVEGLSGKGLRDCKTPEEANEAANDNEVMTRRYIETYLTTVAPVVDGDAALAKGSISFDVSNKLFVSTNTKRASSDLSAMEDKSTVPSPGSLRSSTGSIKVLTGKLNTYGGKLFLPASETVSFEADDDSYPFVNSDGKPVTISFEKTKRENIKDDKVTTIDWKDVSKSINGESNNVLSGFMQWCVAPGSTKEKPLYELRYYGDNYRFDTAKGYYVPNNEKVYDLIVDGDDPSKGKTIERDGNIITKRALGPSNKVKLSVEKETFNIIKPTISLSGNIYCDGDFIVGSDQSNMKEIPHFLISTYAPTDGSHNLTSEYENGVLTAKGDIFIASSLYGNGAIVTEQGDVTFMGDSVLESGSCGVAVYGHNVTLKSLEGAIAQTSDGLKLNQDLTQVPSDYNEDVNLDTCGTYDFIGQLYAKYPNDHSNDEYSRMEEIKKYFKDTLGIYVNVTHSHRKEKSDYEILLKFTDGCGKELDCAEYRILSKNNGMEFSTGKTHLEKLPVPDGSYVEPKRKLVDELPQELQDYAKEYGSVCYGDQRFSGVVYAKQNFTAELGKDFNLIVDGAIRAENGTITVKCRSSKLDYNESYISTLMPTYTGLTCKLWNCW